MEILASLWRPHSTFSSHNVVAGPGAALRSIVPNYRCLLDVVFLNTGMWVTATPRFNDNQRYTRHDETREQIYKYFFLWKPIALSIFCVLMSRLGTISDGPVHHIKSRIYVKSVWNGFNYVATTSVVSHNGSGSAVCASRRPLNTNKMINALMTKQMN